MFRPGKSRSCSGRTRNGIGDTCDPPHTAAEGRSRRRAWRFASRLHGRAVQPKAPERKLFVPLRFRRRNPAEIVQPFKNACVAFLFVRAVRQKDRLPEEGEVAFSK